MEIPYRGISPIKEKKERKFAIALICLFGLISVGLFIIIFMYIYLYEIAPEHKDVFFIISSVILGFMILSFCRYGKEDHLFENLILGVGTLGTFIGIFFAFSQFTLDGNSAEQLYLSITNVIKSLKFIFATSILGIGTSIWLRFLKGSFRHFLNKETDNKLKEKYLFDFMDSISVNTKYLFEMIEQQDKNSVEKLKEINTNVSSIADDFKVQIGEFVENTYQRILDGLYQNIKDKLGETFSAFDAGMKKNVELLQQNKDLFINLSDIYEKTKEQQNILKQLLNNSQENINSQNNFVEQINNKFDSYTTSIKNQQIIFEDFKKLLEEIREKETALNQETTTSLNNIITGIQNLNDNTNVFLESFKTSIDKIMMNIDTQQTEVINKIQTMTTELMTQIETRIKESASNSENMEQKMKENMEGMITGIATQQTEVINKIQIMTTELMTQIETRIKESASNSETTEQKIKENIEKMFENISVQQEDLKQIFEKDRNNLKTVLTETVEEDFKNLKNIVEISNNEFSKILKESIQQYIDVIMKVKESQQTTNIEILGNKANISNDNVDDKKEFVEENKE